MVQTGLAPCHPLLATDLSHIASILFMVTSVLKYGQSVYNHILFTVSVSANEAVGPAIMIFYGLNPCEVTVVNL